MLEEAQRNLQAAVPLQSLMNPCIELLPRPATRSNVETAMAPPDNIQLEHPENAICNKCKLDSALSEFKKRALNAESNLFCVQEVENVLVRKRNFQDVATRELHVE